MVRNPTLQGRAPRTRKSTAGRTRLCVHLPKNLRERVRRYARTRGLDVDSAVTELIDRALAESE